VGNPKLGPNETHEFPISDLTLKNRTVRSVLKPHERMKHESLFHREMIIKEVKEVQLFNLLRQIHFLIALRLRVFPLFLPISLVTKILLPPLLFAPFFRFHSPPLFGELGNKENAMMKENPRN
jgi:hypothetical protein